jgi:hypothetical protein
MTKETWLNIYDYGKAYILGSDLYTSPESATRNLCDKEHYLHTINVNTDAIVKIKLKDKQA